MTIPFTMKAAVSARYGPPEAVRIEDVPVPVPSDTELLVRVRATTVNRTDCGYRGAKPFLIRLFSGWRRPKSPILGTEFAGEVAAAGSEVTRFEVGDRICGYCEGTFGAHAEYMTIGEKRTIARIPSGRSFAEAAPSTEGSHYALGMLRRAGVQSGDAVLINGTTGAIGSAAVQIAKRMGLMVTAVCDTAHVEMVRGLGADRVIDYLKEDFTKDGQRYDLVLDAVGKSSFRRCRRLLKPKAIYTSSDVGFMWHGPLLALITPLLRGRRQIFVVPKPDPEGIRFLVGLIEAGEFTPVLDREYPLDRIVEAYQYVETGMKVGNVVVVV
jgi:NADPH:quinone reductase-like Zn-dependent oxidoreductase